MSQTEIKKYIDRQVFTAAVEKFADRHENKQIDPRQKYYKELLPKKSLCSGEQYAFEVDLDKCTGCKACVTACHNENGLDIDETWRSVGMIQGGSNGNAIQQHITTACHHCVEPACMNGCPTKAYVKDEETGIVKHLDDQCFGCQYCILKCPYDVPKYSKSKGIVHKCDMCTSRLKEGQPPACVRACPNGAIKITIVSQEDVMRKPFDYVNIADAPASDYTFPTTQYKTTKNFPKDMSSNDYHNIQPEHSHLPLVFMLVLTQLSVGAFFAQFLLNHILNPQVGSLLHGFHVGFALFIGLFALATSVMHLGRPQYAFRAILGLRTSWLSREILGFGMFAKAAILYAACSWISPLGDFFVGMFGAGFYTGLSILIFLFGVIGIFCSVMVYKDTRRPFWVQGHTTAKFYLSMIILGFATILNVSLLYALFYSQVEVSYIMEAFGRIFAGVVMTATIVKLVIEASVFYHLTQHNLYFIKKTAILMTRQLKKHTIARFVCGVLGGVLLPALFMQLQEDVSSIGIVILSFLMWGLLLAGELCERYLFFRAVVPLKMPGAK